MASAFVMTFYLTSGAQLANERYQKYSTANSPKHTLLCLTVLYVSIEWCDLV